MCRPIQESSPVEERWEDVGENAASALQGDRLSGGSHPHKPSVAQRGEEGLISYKAPFESHLWRENRTLCRQTGSITGFLDFTGVPRRRASLKSELRRSDLIQVIQGRIISQRPWEEAEVWIYRCHRQWYTVVNVQRAERQEWWSICSSPAVCRGNQKFKACVVSSPCYLSPCISIADAPYGLSKFGWSPRWYITCITSPLQQNLAAAVTKQKKTKKKNKTNNNFNN